MSTYEKYLKYKTKYLNEKKKINSMTGGVPKTKFTLYKAKWCGHCRDFEPTWNKVQQNNTNNNIVFETFEYTNDDHKQIIEDRKITGFPTLHLNNKYYSEREYERIMSDISKII